MQSKFESPRILVIEDEATTRYLLKYHLDARGYRTFLAKSWDEAKFFLEYCQPQLLIVDGLLPNHDGVSICTAVRKHYDSVQLPIILISAFYNGARNTKTMLQASRANSFLHKPIKQTELLREVEAYLGELPQTEPAKMAQLMPEQYAQSQKSALSLLQSFDVEAKRCLELLECGVQIDREQCDRWFSRFLAVAEKAEQEHDDVYFCKKRLEKLAGKILAVHGNASAANG